MPDPFRKVRPGEDVVFSSTAWNAMLAAGQAEQARSRDRKSGNLSQSRSADIVRVKNESGTDLLRRHILGLNGPIFTPTDSEDAFLREVTFRGVTPADPAHLGKFAVLLEPCKAGAIARAFVAGVCQVRVDVQDTDDRFADIEDGETGHLNSGVDGSAEILWREGDEGYGYGYDTGEQWAIVRIGMPCGRSLSAKTGGSGIPAATGTLAGSGTVTLRDFDGTNFSNGDTVICHSDWTTAIGANRVIRVTTMYGLWWVSGEDCP